MSIDTNTTEPQARLGKREAQVDRIPIRAIAWKPVASPPVGEINGLPTLRGKLVATNETLGLLEQPDGTLVEVHKDWFVRDKAENVKLKTNKCASEAARAAASLFDEYI